MIPICFDGYFTTVSLVEMDKVEVNGREMGGWGYKTPTGLDHICIQRSLNTRLPDPVSSKFFRGVGRVLFWVLFISIKVIGGGWRIFRLSDCLICLNVFLALIRKQSYNSLTFGNDLGNFRLFLKWFISIISRYSGLWLFLIRSLGDQQKFELMYLQQFYDG